mmetsp:Transcript_30851/g.38160  ORF Transcript_30851/g.38160 Transcript_30851/m.38160 type:complete len:95 (-) Transcript_30851:19-303(-)
MSFSQAATGQAMPEPPMTKDSGAITVHGAAESSQVGGTAALAVEMIKRREEMEALEARQNKHDFIDYCTKVLTQSKNKDRGDNLPSQRQKHKVL